MFHEHKNITNMEKNVNGLELMYEGVVDLTSERTSLEGATNEVEIPKSEQDT